jgi:ankyrin repeat protein
MNFGMGQQQPASSTNNESSIDSSTPWMAASEGNLPLLQESLTKLQLPITAADENGYTLLQAASSYGQIQLIQWLLSNMPQPLTDLNAVDQEGDSALHYASTDEACRVLVTANIDTTIKNISGKTALEAKQEELQELMDDEDFDDEDLDAAALRACIQYLSSQGQAQS